MYLRYAREFFFYFVKPACFTEVTAVCVGSCQSLRIDGDCMFCCEFFVFQYIFITIEVHCHSSVNTFLCGRLLILLLELFAIAEEDSFLSMSENLALL